ncbi:hypothetical protein ACP70R_020465 [Stipagrostis hirtigluma subsp. patula]
MMMVGHRLHGIRKLEDFTSEKARQEAKRRWLTDKECLAIVANPQSLHWFAHRHLGTHRKVFTYDALRPTRVRRGAQRYTPGSYEANCAHMGPQSE